jgi:hypothetical protein
MADLGVRHSIGSRRKEKRRMKRLIAGLLLAAGLGLAGPAGADGTDVPRKVPPERHVVEVIDDWGRLIIAGRTFTPAVPACGGWVAGERIRFVAGDINGACQTAVIYNYRRHETCEVGCRRFVIW